jgi:hypothetical protein
MPNWAAHMTGVETTRRRNPFDKALKLASLRERQEAIGVKIAKIEAKQKAIAWRAETRLRTIVGAAVLASIEQSPETREDLVTILEKNVTARHDRNFLKLRRWL